MSSVEIINNAEIEYFIKLIRARVFRNTTKILIHIKINYIRIGKLEKEITTNNFEDFHTYYVGKNEILVHNKCGKAVPKRPGGYVKNDVDSHGLLSSGKNRGEASKILKVTVGFIHIIQYKVGGQS